VNVTVNQTALLARAAKKIYRASDRVGFLPLSVRRSSPAALALYVRNAESITSRLA